MSNDSSPSSTGRAAVAGPPRLSRGRRLAFSAVVVLGLLLLAEGGSWLALWRIEAEVDSCFDVPAQLRARREELGERRFAKDSFLNRNVQRQTTEFLALHPYLGFVRNPEVRARARNTGPFGTTAFGTYDREAPLRRRRDDRLLVGVMGGSVAGLLVTDAHETLAAELGGIERFAGREVEIVNLALSRYKQPQQLMLLAYLLSEGGELDLVLNLDGFNEVTAVPVEHRRLGVHPSYPVSWASVSAAETGPELRRAAQQINLLRRQRKALAARFEQSPWTRSGIASILWRTADQRLVRSITEIQAGLGSDEPGASLQGFRATGPEHDYAPLDEMLGGLVARWGRCSRQMQALCVANGIEYHHFLQPNQYVPDSKPMGEAERRVAHNDRSPYIPAVRAGYPLLQTEGRALWRDGIHFHDLSPIFHDVEESLYVDDCCHLSERGSQRLAREMAARVGEAGGSSPSGASPSRDRR